MLSLPGWQTWPLQQRRPTPPSDTAITSSARASFNACTAADFSLCLSVAAASATPRLEQ